MRQLELLHAGMLAIACAAIGLAAGTVPARAGVITLDVSGTMIPLGSMAHCTPTCTLGGDIMINNSPPAPGMILSAAVTATGFLPSVGPFTEHFGIFADGSLTLLHIQDAIFDNLDLVFSTTTPGSLVGYSGGPLDTSTGVGGQCLRCTWLLTSGSLTQAAAAPEPPSLLLLLSALAGLGGLLGKRPSSRRAA